jgi:prepilin-type N-terminal cleavage/methylation domain-containing protein
MHQDTPPRYRPPRRALTLVEVLVVMAIVALLMGLVLPAIQQSREVSRATTCKQNLRQIGIATHAFHAAYRAFPPARIVPRPGDAPQHACGGQEPTWFVHLLPFLEERAADRWNVYEPFADHADALRAMPVSVYVCPTRRSLGQAAAGPRDLAASAAEVRQPRLAMMMLCPVCSGRPRPRPPLPDDPNPPGDEPPPPNDPSDPPPGPRPSATVTGALGDYAGNHGDLSPGATGAATDFYYGGNGTGVLITSRARCVAGKPTEWIDRIRIHNVSDGLSNTFLAGERHVPMTRLGILPDDGSVYDGNSFHFASRLAGPGAQLARSVNDLSAGVYSFGSWHQEVCHFLMADGSVRAVSDQISTTVLGSLSNRHDGNRTTDY